MSNFDFKLQSTFDESNTLGRKYDKSVFVDGLKNYLNNEWNFGKLTHPEK